MIALLPHWMQLILLCYTLKFLQNVEKVEERSKSSLERELQSNDRRLSYYPLYLELWYAHWSFLQCIILIITPLHNAVTWYPDEDLGQQRKQTKSFLFVDKPPSKEAQAGVWHFLWVYLFLIWICVSDLKQWLPTFSLIRLFTKV